MITAALVEKTRLHIRRHFARHIPKWMTFHDLEHTLSVTRYALDIARAMGLARKDLLLLEIAALFHDTGYGKAYKGHEEESAKLARTYLTARGLDVRSTERVAELILATRMHSRPRGVMERILRDADSAKAGQVDFMEKAERLRRELEHVLGKRISQRAWTLENIGYLEQHRFHTSYAQERFGLQKSINLRELQEALQRHRKKPAPLAKRAEPFFDRDLSWLAFNGRVLQEAQDPRTPLLERLKFLAIHSSNLDEFYRVRVAQLRSLNKLGKHDRSALEVPAEKRLALINSTALKQQQAFGEAFRNVVLPGLAEHGIRFVGVKELSKVQRGYVEEYFRERIAPLLSTAALRAGNAPFIEDRKLYLACELGQRGSPRRKHVVVNVPSDELGRFITLPARKGRTELLFLDDAIRLCAPRFFSGFKLLACHAIKLSRDAELYLDEEFAENVVDKVRRSLRKRRTGVPARFLYDATTPPRLLKRLRELLDLRRQDLIPGGRYHNLSDLMNVPVEGHPDLRNKPLPPLPHPRLGKTRDPFAAIRKTDVLLHFPYHDYRVVTDLLRKAARDPHVSSISITLYRVARTSTVCEALLEAARNGKRVNAHVEVQARFDEGNNLFWGEALEQGGVRVTYGREGRKVHCKLCLIERREERTLRRYAYLGTGNFNERTATIYGDMALLTVHPGITRDVADTFSFLADQERSSSTKHLMVAPHGLRSALERSIDLEIANALSGAPASILLKVNSLEDRPLIRKLYDASRAGVQVRVIVRGICCLVPGVKEHSANIQVISIVDRFLEHARAYVFHNGGRTVVHLASADWMERNMDRRVEVAFPVLDERCKAEVLELLELQWQDNVKARVIDKRQSNAYRPRPKGARAIRSQQDWYERLAAGQ
ncbi:MAG TPA: polyphosphate kinase 1 [Flavobacteriales bacterium]